MKKLFNLISFWAFILCTTLIVLQMIPYTGVFLWMVGAPIIAGLLIHVFLLSVVVEALLGRIPKPFLVIPLLVYGGYYAFYFYQGYAISSREAELQANNPGQLLKYDPIRHSLVVQDPAAIVKGHHIPVAFEANKNFPEGYLSHRLMRKEECETIPKDSQSRVQKFGVIYKNRELAQAFRQNGSGLCHLRFPERPIKPLITVTNTDPEIWKRRLTISEAHYTVEFGGKTYGTFTTASVFRVSPLPLFYVGCGLESSQPAWKCTATVKTHWHHLQTMPPSVDQKRFTYPVSVLLGIEKYTTEELVHYQSPPVNLRALKRVQGEAHRVQDDVFAQLDTMFVDKQMKPPHNMGYSLAKNPERLAAKAEEMVTLFETLHTSAASEYAHMRLKTEALSTAITALPQATFEKYALRIFHLIQPEKRYDRYPRLYIRGADVGPQALDFYGDQFTNHRVHGWLQFLPVLAICRIGNVEKELLTQLKLEFQMLDVTKPNNDRYHQSLFVTLLRLGERAFVKNHYRREKLRDPTWYETILAGNAQRSLERDNCVIKRW